MKETAEKKKMKAKELTNEEMSKVHGGMKIILVDKAKELMEKWQKKMTDTIKRLKNRKML